MVLWTAIALGALGIETPTVWVRWAGAPGCPDQAEVVASIQALSDAEVVDDPEQADVAVDVQVTDDGAAYHAAVAVRSAGRHRARTIADGDCATVGRAVAVVAAVALDPIRVMEVVVAAEAAAAEAAAAEPEPEPEVETGIVGRPAIVDPRRRPETLEYGARFGAGVGGLVLPGGGLGFGVAPFVGGPRFHARLVAQYWAPRRRRLEGVDGAGGTFQLAAAGVRACPILVAQRVRFPLCAGIDAGAVIGTGRGGGLSETRSVSAPWAAVVFEAGLEVPVGRAVGLWVAFEGAVSLNQPRFHLDNGGELHRTGRFGPRGLFGLVLHRPRSIP